MSLSPDLVAEAKDLGVNISQASERGLRQAISEARAARWLDENGAALDAYNDYVQKYGLPLADQRLF